MSIDLRKTAIIPRAIYGPAPLYRPDGQLRSLRVFVDGKLSGSHRDKEQMNRLLDAAIESVSNKETQSVTIEVKLDAINNTVLCSAIEHNGQHQNKLYAYDDTAYVGCDFGSVEKAVCYDDREARNTAFKEFAEALRERIEDDTHRQSL